MDVAAIDRSLECIAEVREAIGPEAAILLDTRGSPTPELSIEFARRAATCSPMFLEAPVRVGSVDALMEVTHRSPVPIATGGQLLPSGNSKS